MDWDGKKSKGEKISQKAIIKEEAKDKKKKLSHDGHVISQARADSKDSQEKINMQDQAPEQDGWKLELDTRWNLDGKALWSQ